MSDREKEACRLVNRWTKKAFKPDLKPLKLYGEINEVLENIPKVTNINDAVMTLGVSHLIRVIAGHCSYHQWQEIVGKLLDLASDIEKTEPSVDASIFQLAAVELPLSIAFQVPEVENLKELALRACRKMEVTSTDMLDHDGWPLSCFLERFGVLVASWARSNLILERLDLRLKSDVEAQMEWLVRQTIRMLRPDRTLVFSIEGSQPATPAFWYALEKMSADPIDWKLIQRQLESPEESPKPKQLPSASNISEWAEAALLQVNWKRKSPKLAVDFSNQSCRIELSNGNLILQGRVFPTILADRNPVSPLSNFEVICDNSDDDIEYLELEMELTDELVFNRQLMLSRADRILLLADFVSSKVDRQIDYELAIPYAPGISGLHETENREIYLCDPKIRSLALPLALPEWKSDLSPGKFLADKEGLVLRQKASGKSLYAPVLFDLNSKRSRKKRTWRQLTVAEDRRPVSKDVACAFRIQLNEQQWFFYRALEDRGNRTFLGENFNGEFIFNRFKRDGSVVSLIEIQNGSLPEKPPSDSPAG